MATELAFCCGNCGKKMRVPVNFAGRRGMCPRCEGQFTIPSLEAIDAVAPDRLNVQPDVIPDKPAAATQGDDHTAMIGKQDVEPEEDDELEPFDPNAALNYSHPGDSDDGNAALAAADASADDDGTPGGDPFEMDYFAEPTGEVAEIEEVEAADLEQATVGPTPVPKEVMEQAKAMGLEVGESDGPGVGAADIGVVDSPMEPIDVDSSEIESVDTPAVAEPIPIDEVELLDPEFDEPVDAVAVIAEVAEAEPLEAEVLDDAAFDENAFDDALDSGFNADTAEVAIPSAEDIAAAGAEPIAAAEPADDLFEEPEFEQDFAQPDEADIGEAQLADEDEEDEQDGGVFTGGPPDLAPANDDALEMDPEALAQEDGDADDAPADEEGQSDESESEGQSDGDGALEMDVPDLGDDEDSQWDDELGDGAPSLDADIGDYLDSADVDAELPEEELAVPDLDIPTGDMGGEDGGDPNNDSSTDHALTMVLELDDIMEASEEIEPPPVGLDTMEIHQLLAHCKQLHNKEEHVKPSPELLARLETVEMSPEMMLFRGHLKKRVGQHAAGLEDYLQAKEQGKSDDLSLATIDRHELDVLLEQVNQFIDEEPDRAANLLRGIVAERPGYAKAHYFLGLALLASGDKAASLTELREALKLGHEVPELDELEYEVELQTLEILRENDPRRLLVKLPPFLARWSSSARGYELLALALRSAGNRQSSLEAYRKARSLGQTSAETDRIIYDLLVDLGRDDDAQLELEKHLEHDNPDPFWVRVKFDQHFMLKHRRESLEALCQLALSADGNPELLHNIRMLFSFFEREEGITMLRKARSLDPESPLLARLLADLLCSVGAYNESLDIYTKLLEDDEGNSGILMSRALCWQMQMPPHPDKALADLRAAFP